MGQKATDLSEAAVNLSGQLAAERSRVETLMIEVVRSVGPRLKTQFPLIPPTDRFLAVRAQQGTLLDPLEAEKYRL
ncbi:MAG: hypothetical protein AB7P49_00885 [Bdellovibrionales bacterium]